MRRHRFHLAIGLIALFAGALIAAGCGGDDSTSTSTSLTSTSVGENATQSVDAAVKSCTDEAQQLGGVAGTALDGACTSVGTAATQAVAAGGDQAQQALAQAAKLVQELGQPGPEGPGAGRALTAL